MINFYHSNFTLPEVNYGLFRSTGCRSCYCNRSCANRKKHEISQEKLECKLPEGAVQAPEYKISVSRKLSWLRNLLWGGVLLLAFEHLWHGELTPYFPFLTGASNAEDTATMLHEMATVGVAMSLLVTAVWGIMLLVVKIKETKISKEKELTE